MNAKKLGKQLNGGAPHFAFQVKFYPPDPVNLNEEITRYQLFLQLRCDVLYGSLPCSFITMALLGSYAAQSQLGDYVLSDHGTGSSYLKDISFAQNQSQELLDKIAELHKTHLGMQPAEAELNYLDNACKLSLYGVHMFRAKDGEDGDVEIGICAAGILVFKERLRVHRFTWPKILKISYKRNIFTIKIRPGEFEQMETTMDYKLTNYQASKRLWRLAVEHHGFFRLRETEPLPKGLFSRFGPKYRYCGKTFYQAQQIGDKSQRSIARVVGRKFVGSKSMETVLTGYSTERSETYQQQEGSRTATLDLKKRRQNSLHDLTNDNQYTLSSNGGECYVNHGGQMWTGWDGSRKQLIDRDTISRSATSDEATFPLEPYQTNQHYDGYQSYERMAKNTIEEPSLRRNNQYDMLYERGTRSSDWDHINADTSRSYIAADGARVTEYRSQRDGVIETRIEKRYPDGGQSHSVDYDKALSDAILAVTNVDTNLAVEKIEIQTREETNATMV